MRPMLKQSLDTALVVVLLLLLIGLLRSEWGFVQAALTTLIIAMLIPGIFSPLATVWFGLAERLSGIGTQVILALLFGLILVPVGVVRRWFGYDPMDVRSWKNGSASVFRKRETCFTKADMTNPF